MGKPFPSSQRRGGCAERMRGADGVARSASPIGRSLNRRAAETLRRTDHPGASALGLSRHSSARRGMVFLCSLCSLFLYVSTLSAQSSLPIIVDTDAGADDMMALAYLLSSRDARIEAITVVHGVAHVSEGARNIRRLLNLAGRPEIPVFEGQERPLQGLRPFPADWRALADKLPRVDLPGIGDTGSAERAGSYFKRRAKGRKHPGPNPGLRALT